MFKGWRTVLTQVGIAVGTAGLAALVDFDWTDKVGGVGAVIIVNIIAIAQRFITTGPIGTKVDTTK